MCRAEEPSATEKKWQEIKSRIYDLKPVLEVCSCVASKQDSLPKEYVPMYYEGKGAQRVRRTIQLGKDEEVVEKEPGSY